jgi:hypothetical protein
MLSKRARFLVVGLAVAVVGVASLTVWAGEPTVTGGRDSFGPNKTTFFWSTDDAQTSSEGFKHLPDVGNSSIKHFGAVVVTYTVKVSGDGPAQFRIQDDKFKPREVNFDPSASPGVDTFSFTAVKPGNDWSCSDVGLQWRSPTGAELELSFVNVSAAHKRKNEEPDYGCLEKS